MIKPKKVEPDAIHVVLGASPNPNRYSYIATSLLAQRQFNVYPVGIRSGKIHDIAIQKDFPLHEPIDTITLYLNPHRQKAYISLIIDLHPRRVIFNPGTEDRDSMDALTAQGIECIEACTLVMLRTGQY